MNSLSLGFHVSICMVCCVLQDLFFIFPSKSNTFKYFRTTGDNAKTWVFLSVYI